MQPDIPPKSILEQKLELLARFYDLEAIKNLQPDNHYVQQYYQASQLGYTIFHTRTGLMYMGISRNGKFQTQDLLEAARTVTKYIDPQTTTNILELATGRGATSGYLAKRFPNIRFDGIDLSPGQLHYAKRRARKFSNYHPVQGDYHDLGRYQSESMDIVFEIEALCYSQNKSRVFEQVYNLLKPGGVFILLDGYAISGRDELPEPLKSALILTEKSMAVPRFEAYEQVLSYAHAAGFSLKESEDVSEFIMPTLKKFESIASFFLRRRLLMKILRSTTPPAFSNNGVAAYLFPELMRQKAGFYYITVLQKPVQ